MERVKYASAAVLAVVLLFIMAWGVVEPLSPAASAQEAKPLAASDVAHQSEEVAEITVLQEWEFTNFRPVACRFGTPRRFGSPL